MWRRHCNQLLPCSVSNNSNDSLVEFSNVVPNVLSVPFNGLPVVVDDPVVNASNLPSSSNVNNFEVNNNLIVADKNDVTEPVDMLLWSQRQMETCSPMWI